MSHYVCHALNETLQCSTCCVRLPMPLAMPIRFNSCSVRPVIFYLSPEWPPLRGLIFRRSRVRDSPAPASLVICIPHLHRVIRGAQGVLSFIGWGVTVSQLDLPSLTPLSVSVFGRLQLGASHWATSVVLLQVVDNLPPILWYYRFSTKRLLAMEDFTCTFKSMSGKFKCRRL